MRFLPKIIVLILTVFTTIVCNGQDSLILKKKYKRLYYYTWGLPKFRNESVNRNCELELQKVYGFGKKVKAGCVVKRGQTKRWRKHNNRIEKKMIKRHGADWRSKFEIELEKCHQKD